MATTTTPDGDVIDWVRPTAEMLVQPPPNPTPPPDALPLPPDAAPAPGNPVPSEVDIGPKGPPTMVPFVRTKEPQCDCFDGYLRVMNGSCKPKGAVQPGEAPWR